MLVYSDKNISSYLNVFSYNYKWNFQSQAYRGSHTVRNKRGGGPNAPE
jgi:hypothetical protein